MIVSNCWKSLQAIALLVLFSFALTVTSCIPATGHQRGIRIESYEALSTTPSAKVPLPGVGNSGDFVIEQGPPSSVSGTQQSFEGATGLNAVSDYPEARDNAFWTLTSWLLTIPVCGIASGQFFVNAGGETFEAICYL